MTNNEPLPPVDMTRVIDDMNRLAAQYNTTPATLLFDASCALDTIATRRTIALLTMHFVYVSDSLLDELMNEHFSD